AGILPGGIDSTSLVSRNVTIAGHRTSVRLEPDMWAALKEICRRERASMHEVCTTVAQHKQQNSSLTAAIRVFIMAYFRAAATDDGHQKAGHGNGATNGVNVTVMPQSLPPPQAQSQSQLNQQPSQQVSHNSLRDDMRAMKPMGRW
ncbi:MAG: ribbon-helix-helix domain-containing protein, partial [Hyphomicrobium sp.]